MANRTCSVEGCDRPHDARGFCIRHYKLWQRNGTPARRVKQSTLPCTVEGCEKPRKGRGFCATHYRRWQIHGDPLTVLKVHGDDEGRFWSRVDRSSTYACWEWTGGRFGNGYGRLVVADRGVPAHRFSYELLVGPIPAGLVIDHLCHNRGCVNPAHLKAVTVAENNKWRQCPTCRDRAGVFS